MISISSNFDAGAIEVANAASSADIQLNIRADSHAEFRQWFYFRLQGARGEPCTIRLLNAGACTYAGGWSGVGWCREMVICNGLSTTKLVL